MLETFLTAIAGVIAAYFVLAFLVTAIVIGCGFYFVWRITK